MKLRARILRHDRGGWLLVAVLIAVVVLCTLALALAPAWIRYFAMEARSKEGQEMRDLQKAFRDGIVDDSRIPAPTGFVAVVRGRAGKSDQGVQFNPVGRQRVILADPEVSLGPGGTNTLPFNQGQTGSAPPRNGRLLVISSMGKDLPANIVTGANLTAAQFSNLWNAPHGRKPADWNWDGDPLDLCIERLQLSDLFVTVTLRYYADSPEHRGRYLVSSDPGATNAPALLPSPAFTNAFLRGTYLSLHGTNGSLQFRQILQDSSLTYTCQDGIWRQGQGTRGTRVGPVIRHPTPEEFADALEAFLDSQVALWPDNSGATKADMFSAITNFLATGAYANQGQHMSSAQNDLIDVWVSFTGAQPNKP